MKRTTKWSFLLQAEAPSRGGVAFYQFVPYLYGPFSFCLYQEANSLARRGYLLETEKDWSLTATGFQAADTTPSPLDHDAAAIVEQFGAWTTAALLEYVYDRYEWFTFNAAQGARIVRPVSSPAVYTAGYQGLLIDGFLVFLLSCGIQCLIDVRANPVSRRYGYHKTTLRRLCDKVGIEYSHFPELGIPSALRQHLETREDYEALLDMYEKTVLARESAAVAETAFIMGAKASALVCMEADSNYCHRSRLARAIAGKTRLPIHHLAGAA